MSSEDRIERSVTMPGPCISPPGPGGEMQGPGMVTLRSILSSLDIPELEPVSRDHVLTKTFFLLRDFPGRFTTGQLWVEALPAETEAETNRPAPAGAGAYSILITANALAGARRAVGLFLGFRRQCLDPKLAGGEAAGEVAQQEEGFGEHVICLLYTSDAAD